MQKNNKEFILINKKNEAENITSIFFKPTDGIKYKYIPGQYVNIKPPSITGHNKSYTISSIPSDEFVCITIKRKGEVSSALIDSKVGDKLMFNGPYGYFYPEKAVGDIVIIAGSIGITPFYSFIKDTFYSKNKNNILLFYSNKKINQTPFFDELNKLSKDHPVFKIIHCLTEEKTKHPLVKEYVRINEKMLKKYIVSANNKCYYVCGSVEFVDAIWKTLKKIGVLEEFIFTESFF